MKSWQITVLAFALLSLAVFGQEKKHTKDQRETKQEKSGEALTELGMTKRKVKILSDFFKLNLGELKNIQEKMEEVSKILEETYGISYGQAKRMLSERKKGVMP